MTLFHFLKIRHYAHLDGASEAEQAAALAAANASPDPVYAVQYEEMVFSEPTEQFYEILKSKGDAVVPAEKRTGGRGGGKERDPANPFCRAMEEEEIDRLQLAIRKVNEIVKQKRDAVGAVEKEVVEIRAKREALEEEREKRRNEAEKAEEEEEA